MEPWFSALSTEIHSYCGASFHIAAMWYRGKRSGSPSAQRDVQKGI